MEENVIYDYNHLKKKLTSHMRFNWDVFNRLHLIANCYNRINVIISKLKKSTLIAFAVYNFYCCWNDLIPKSVWITKWWERTKECYISKAEKLQLNQIEVFNRINRWFFDCYSAPSPLTILTFLRQYHMSNDKKNYRSG